jgi:hypothetical protein
MRPLVALVVAKLIALTIRTRNLAVFLILVPAPALIPGASLSAIPSVIPNFVLHTNNAEVLPIG